jgi:hypothetical protein
MRRTTKELARLARVSRQLGHFGMHEGERGTWSFVCPVAYEKPHDGLAHRFPVHHLPWEHTPTAAMITAALRRHLEDADENGEPC